MPHPAEMPFSVVMLGIGQDPSEYAEWVKSCAVPPTIVAEKGGDLTYAELTLEKLQRRFLTACDDLPPTFDSDFAAQVKGAIESWSPMPTRSLNYKVGGHATVTPNLVALSVLGFQEMVRERFNKINQGVAPYVEQVVLALTRASSIILLHVLPISICSRPRCMSTERISRRLLTSLVPRSASSKLRSAF
jgi:hypothetical protein